MATVQFLITDCHDEYFPRTIANGRAHNVIVQTGLHELYAQ